MSALRPSCCSHTQCPTHHAWSVEHDTSDHQGIPAARLYYPFSKRLRRCYSLWNPHLVRDHRHSSRQCGTGNGQRHDNDGKGKGHVQGKDQHHVPAWSTGRKGQNLPKGFEHLWCQCLAAGAAEAGSRSGRPRSSLLEGQAQASAAACRVHECISTAALEPSRP